MRFLEGSLRIESRLIVIVGGLLVGSACGGNVGSDNKGQASNVGGADVGGQGTGGKSSASSAGAPVAAGGNSFVSSGGATAATGGSSSKATGGLPSTGGSSTGLGGLSNTTGGISADFCTGSAKVNYKNQLLAPAVTQYHPLDVRNCCMSYGIRLHTSESIGSDLEIVVSHMAGRIAAGDYVLESGTYPWGAGLRTPAESIYTQHHATGHLYITGDSPEVTPWQMGVCIQVDDTSSDLFGTQVYVPGLPMDYAGVYDRFGIWLLADASITATAAAQVPLDSLTLASAPWISLSYFEYVEQSTGLLALNSSMYSGDSLRTSLGQVNLYGLPFVVVADSVRIYMGSFYSSISSVAVPGPTITVQDMKNDGFTITAPRSGPPGAPPVNDPRNDPRILKVLTETGRFSP